MFGLKFFVWVQTFRQAPLAQLLPPCLCYIYLVLSILIILLWLVCATFRFWRMFSVNSELEHYKADLKCDRCCGIIWGEAWLIVVVTQRLFWLDLLSNQNFLVSDNHGLFCICIYDLYLYLYLYLWFVFVSLFVFAFMICICIYICMSR